MGAAPRSWAGPDSYRDVGGARSIADSPARLGREAAKENADLNKDQRLSIFEAEILLKS